VDELNDMRVSPPPDIAGVLFDKDGTLVDFRATWVPAYLGVAAELATLAAAPVTPDQLLRRIGYTHDSGVFAENSPLLWATNAMIAAQWAEEPELAGVDVLQVVEGHFSDLERYPPQSVGDLASLLGRLRARGLRLGLATMDSTHCALATVEIMGIGGALDFLIGADGGHGVKPEPGMVAAFCAACGLEPASVALVGDTPADLLMGRRAGCGLVVGVLTGGTSAAALAPLADHVVASVMELESLLPG
jgi:phosphoglycolate phosphatase